MSTNHQLKYRKSGLKAIIWLISFVVVAGGLWWFLDLKIFNRPTEVVNITEQNRVRQVIDENYYDWESTTLESYAPLLAQAIGATWPTAYQIWPNTHNDFSQQPLIVMYEGTQNVWFFYANGNFEEKADYATQNNLENLTVGDYYKNGLSGFDTNQEILVKVVDYEVFSDPLNQSAQWTSAPLPGNLFAELTKAEFIYAQSNLDQNQTANTNFSSVNFNYPIDIEARRVRMEILSALQTAYLEEDSNKQKNHLERAAYFYQIYKQDFATDADLLHSSDVNLGNTGYFTLQMRLKAGLNYYNSSEDLTIFTKRVVRGDLTLEKFALNLTTDSETQWLGALSGLILDQLGNVSWKQTSVNNNLSALEQLLTNYQTTQTFENDTRVTRLFEQTVQNFWQNLNQNLETYQNDFETNSTYLVINNDNQDFNYQINYNLNNENGEQILTNLNGQLNTRNGTITIKNARANIYNENVLNKLCGNNKQIFLAIPETALNANKQVVLNTDNLQVDISVREASGSGQMEKSYYCSL